MLYFQLTTRTVLKPAAIADICNVTVTLTGGERVVLSHQNGGMETMGTIAGRTTRESMEVAITCDYQHTYMCCYDYHYQHVHNNVLQSGCYLLFLDVAKHALLLSTAHTHTQIQKIT